MGIYQIKFKGVEGINGYEIFLSPSVEDTIKQFQDYLPALKKMMGDDYKPKEIERLELLFDTDDCKEVKTQLIDRLEEAFRVVGDLGKLGWCCVEERRFNVWELQSLMNSLQERFDEIYSVISAYYDITENKRSDFGKLNEEETIAG